MPRVEDEPDDNNYVRRMLNLKQPINWAGGKHYLVKKIIQLMPRHTHYVEPYAGGLSVLLNRDPLDQSLWVPGYHGVSELVNDRHKELTTFWRVLQDEQLFAQFLRRSEATPFSRVEFEYSKQLELFSDPVGIAWAFFVRVRQSRSGDQRNLSPRHSRMRGQMDERCSRWLNAVQGLPAAHDRLKRVVVENLQATVVIEREDSPTTLFYLDPPYLRDTRNTYDLYKHEMSGSEHEYMLDLVKQCKGLVMLSGYISKLYDEALSSWNRVCWPTYNRMSRNKSRRLSGSTEVLWMNY